MKKILLVIVLLVAVVGGMPLGFGFWADYQMNRMLEQMSESGDLDYTVIKSRRGWFSSSSDIVLEISGDMGDAYQKYQRRAEVTDIKPLSVKLRNTIYHGPVNFAGFAQDGVSLLPTLATITTRIVSIGGEEVGEEGQADRVPYSIITRIGFSGAATTRIDVPPLHKMVDNAQTTVDWQGMVGEVSYNPANRRMVADIKAAGMSVDNPEGRFETRDWNISADMTEVVKDIAVGDATFEVASVAFVNRRQEGKDFHLQGLKISTSTDADEKILNSRVDFALQQVQGDGQQFGPGQFSMQLRKLDIDALASINRQVKELQKQGIPQEQMGMMMGATMISVLPQILKQQPELEISEFSLMTDKGAISGKGKIAIEASDEAVFSNPMLIRDAVVADIRVQIPESVLRAINVMQAKRELTAQGLDFSGEQIDSMARNRAGKKIEGLVAGHILERSGELYIFAASMSNGQVTVNGRPFQVPGAPAR